MLPPYPPLLINPYVQERNCCNVASAFNYIRIRYSRFIVLTRSPSFHNLSTLQEHGADSVRH